jgi:hypothetical protein
MVSEAVICGAVAVVGPLRSGVGGMARQGSQGLVWLVRCAAACCGRAEGSQGARRNVWWAVLAWMGGERGRSGQDGLAVEVGKVGEVHRGS